MKLSQFLDDIGVKAKDFSTEITSLTQDSRRVLKGSIFFALRGSREAKTLNLNKALSQGAKAVVHDVDEFKEGFYVKNIHKVFSECLHLFYKESFENLKVYGVTGTNGKTTYAYMLKSLLESYNVPTGVFGTVENSFKGHALDTGLTSPIAEDFYSFNHKNYTDRGMKALVCEVSSHALDQKRMGLNFLNGAAFTSFSQDHLDYHKNMSTYLEAKLKIFKEATKDESFFCVSLDVREALVRYDVYKNTTDLNDNESLGENTELKNLEVLNLGDFKISHKTNSYGFDVEFSRKFSNSSQTKVLKGYLPILGSYNVSNFGLALMTLCHHFGDEFFPDSRVFKSFKTPPGRMEPVFFEKKPIAYIDYSHTPDSLEKALKTLKNLRSKVFVVYGCGGNRDSDKRAKMGAVAEAYSDLSYVTSDNPRDEDARSIINNILKGYKKTKYIVEMDRKTAIFKALEEAHKADAVVLIAGKGHEKTQEIKGETFVLSDKQEALNWLESKKI